MVRGLDRLHEIIGLNLIINNITTTKTLFILLKNNTEIILPHSGLIRLESNDLEVDFKY